jgi:replication fork protection complex subunit Csm3/Swi3
MAPDTKTRDTVTNLLNYGISDDDDDPFREIDTTLHEPNNGPQGTKRKAAGSGGQENADTLGLDEEVKITKKRKPVAKLDEARLLSQPGIPKLRALARSRSIGSKLRLKGKGHEYSDAAQLLSYYQLWLDNLYPRAKFADGLQLVEKVGHGKRMQIMRREWIDEGKPGHDDDGESRHDPANVERQNGNESLAEIIEKPSSDKPVKEGTKTRGKDSIFGDLDEGEEDGLFFAEARGDANADHGQANEPDEDELDALLAETTASNDKQADHRQPASDEENFDDLDALLAEQTARDPQFQMPSRLKQREVNLDGEDDLNALLAENQAERDAQSKHREPEHGDLLADEDRDELDALLAEQAVRPS